MSRLMMMLRWIEMAGIYGGMPLLLLSGLIPFRTIIGLWLVCIFALLMLLRDRSFDRTRLRALPVFGWGPLLLRFGVITGALTLYTVLFELQRFGALLLRDPALWLLLMVLYPVLSVVPQEIVYRVFFFHRYGPLFRSRNLLVLTNAVLFAFGHILFTNAVAPAAAFFAGLLWASTYLRTRSLPVVSLEHALYGNTVFTLGIGHYVYDPNF